MSTDRPPTCLFRCPFVSVAGHQNAAGSESLTKILHTVILVASGAESVKNTARLKFQGTRAEYEEARVSQVRGAAPPPKVFQKSNCRAQTTARGARRGCRSAL